MTAKSDFFDSTNSLKARLSCISSEIKIPPSLRASQNKGYP